MHSYNIQIFTEDVDFQGIVYYANYLKFLERARTVYFYEKNIKQNEIKEKHNIHFVVRDVSIKYISPAKMDDIITVKTKVVNLTKYHFSFCQQIKIGEKTIVDATTKVVCVSETTNQEGNLKIKVATIPEFIYKQFR